MTPRTSIFSVTAIIPARNEAGNIGIVVSELLGQRRADGTLCVDEVIVVDNGSLDATALHARAAGATVIHVAQAGYGRACWEGSQVAHGNVLLFVDGDGAANPADVPKLLHEIENGADLVVGVRAQPEPNSMSSTQRFGNTLACLLIRTLWGYNVSDLGPHRAIRREAYDAIDMQDRSFGWTVEMQVRAHVLHQRVVQIPVQWRARLSGNSKISGTLRGVWGAGTGILGMVLRLWRQERRRRHSIPLILPSAATHHPEL